MPYRVAIGGIAHETNTFCNPTRLRDFTDLRGEAMLQAHRGVRTYIGGMLDAAARLGIEPVPTFEGVAGTSGTIEGAAMAALTERLVAGIRSAGPLDGLCLALHGAAVAEGCDDVETAVLRAVRAAVGDRMPITGTLDLHGNLQPEMLPLATALFGVQRYPHVDSYERGVEAMECLDACLRGRLHPVMALQQLPLLIPPTTSDLEPVLGVNEFCQSLERRPGVLDVTFFHGFPHTDIPRMGVSVLAVADGDPGLAAEVAREAAELIWRRRAEFDVQHPGAEGALALARARVAEVGGPVVMNDTSDNPGGGGPGDATHLLRAVLAAAPPRTAFGYLHDPETAAQAHRAGVGAEIAVRLGGKTYPLHGEPIAATAYVKALTDGRFVLSTPMGRGSRVDLGPMARLQVSGVDVLVASGRDQVLDPEGFLLNGIDVTQCDLVVVKSNHHFRAGFSHLAKAIVTADTPGWTSLNLRSFPYRRLQRPIAPLDSRESPFADGIAKAT